MTLNHAIDRLLESKINLNLEQQNLKFSLIEMKMQKGGNTPIENKVEVENIIEFGNKEGIVENN
jgi:hypothetical protein